MGVVTEVPTWKRGWNNLEDTGSTICPFCKFFLVFMTKRYIRIIRWLSVKARFFLECGFANEIIPILVGGWNLPLFLYTHVRPIFAFCLCRSCYDQGLPRFPYNPILQRHVYMTISDLPHSYTHLSKLSHRHECRPKHCKDFQKHVSVRWQLL